jgi:hypothetical protein
MSSVIAKKQFPDGFSADALGVLMAMSLTDGKSLKVMGSMALRSQVYAGDYDAYEVVSVGGPRPHAIRHMVRAFKKAVASIAELPMTYIGDIKSGSVEDWKVIADTYNYEASQKKMRDLLEQGVITRAEYDVGMRMLKPHMSRIEMLEARQALRFNVVRWKPHEVMRGYVVLADGRKMTLEEAFQTPAITKIDAVSWVQNSRFTDFSIIYEFRNRGEVLNPAMRNVEAAIRDNIFALHHEKNYFKMAKRMFSLAMIRKDTGKLRALSEMFNGDLGRLYQVYGDIGTLESMVADGGQLPYARIEIEIDQFKGRLSNIGMPAYLESEPRILAAIDEIIEIRKSTYTRERLAGLLMSLRKRIYAILTANTKKYMDAAGI